MATRNIHQKTCPLTNRLYEIITEMPKEQQRHLLQVIDKPKGRERRKCRRKPCFMPVDYTIQHHIYQDYVSNISPDGMFIASKKQFETGHQLRLEISVPKIRNPIEVGGEIMWASEQGFGIQLIWQTNI
jgi:hypothetical protein